MSSPLTPARGTRALVAPELLPTLNALPAFDLSLDILRAIRSGNYGNGKVTTPFAAELRSVMHEQRLIPGIAGAPEVRIFIYSPPEHATSPRPAYLHMHGGGFVMGTPEINDASNRSLVLEHGCIVVSVEYRLAPETRFPGPVEDCYAALYWLWSHADELQIDKNCIAIGGESAGAGHAAALALLNRQRGQIEVCLQLLDSPMLDDRTGSTAEPHPVCGEFVWTSASNRFAWEALLGAIPGSNEVPPGSVPARVADLTGLPAAFIVVGALDLFLEESMEFARRLIRAGVTTELHVIPGAFHGFGAVASDAPQLLTCQRLRREALARAFAKATDSVS